MVDERDRSLPKTPPAGGEYYVFRDAVHNLIEIDDAIEGRFLRLILGTRELQRLRRIKQNGISALVYQSLEGSRFSHALGAYHIARKIIRHLQSNEPREAEGFPDLFRINERALIAFPLAALVHDIGHGPLSHVWEDLFGSHHEEIGRMLIKDASTRLNKLLSKASDIDPFFERFDGIIEDVLGILENTHHLYFLFPLISGHLDVDRLDFMARDTRSAGVTYGFHDLEWIIRSLRFARIPAHVLPDGTIGRSQWVVAVDGRKGLNTLVQFLRARENMYGLVYHHKTSRAAQCLLQQIFSRVETLMKSATPPNFPTRYLEDWFNGDQSWRIVTKIEDDDVLCAIKLWADSDDKILAILAGKFLERDLYKVVEVSPEVADFLRSVDSTEYGRHLMRRVKSELDVSVLGDLRTEEKFWYEFDKTHFDVIGDPHKDDLNPIWIIRFGPFGLEYTPLRQYWIEQFGEKGLSVERHYVHCINVAVAEVVQAYVEHLPDFSATKGEMDPIQVGTFKPIRLISKSGATKEVYLGVNVQPGSAPRSLVAMKYYKNVTNVERDLEAPNLKLEGADRRNITLANGYQHPSDARQYVLVETCWHAPIEALIKKNGLRRQIDEILDMGQQLFRGLSVLHVRNIRHTDIKLDNCGYNYDGHDKVYKIGDFGCMSITPAEMPSPLLVGTKRTIAPERLGASGKIGLASDVWALGTTLYAACVGQYWFLPVSMPHAGEERAPAVQTQLEVLEAAVVADIPKAVRGFRERVAIHLPPLLARLLQPCFADFESRASATVVADEFQRARQTLIQMDANQRAKVSSLWSQFEDLSALADRGKIRELRDSSKSYEEYVPADLWNS